MLTNVIDMSTATADILRRRTDAAQKVVVVNGGNEVIEVVETVLDAGHYDVVFVEAVERAYSQIKRVHPDLVVLCIHVDDVEGFRVVSMLKLDADTRNIPVLTYTMDEGTPEADDDLGLVDDTMFPRRPAARMN